MKRAFTAIAAPGRLMTPTDVEQYLETTVIPALKEALADMRLSQPANPLEWLAAHLLELVPREIKFTASEVPLSPSGAHSAFADTSNAICDTSLRFANVLSAQVESLKAQLRDTMNSESSSHLDSKLGPAVSFSVSNAIRVADAQIGSLKSQLHSLETQLAAASASLVAPPAFFGADDLTTHSETGSLARFIELDAKRHDQAYMKGVFEMYLDMEGGLSPDALLLALKEVDAPILSSSGANVSAQTYHRLADINMSGVVDLNEFIRVSNLPDELEMFLHEHNLSVLAPALRAHASASADQLDSISSLTVEQLNSAVDASIISLKDRLCRVRQHLQKIKHAEGKREDWILNQTGKFQIRKMEVGSLQQFHEGLTERVGSPNLDFEQGMRAEHCSLRGHSYEFTTPNYKITTTPRKEWLYIVGNEQGQSLKCPDMDHKRRIVPIHELLKKDLAEKSRLTRAEMIAVVLYTGPLFVVYNAILRRFPKDVFEAFCVGDDDLKLHQGDVNNFATTIFVLVSAIHKLSRVMIIPAGVLLYRGLGGLMDLPDSFSTPDEYGCTGYCEFGFMSTTADRDIAVEYSGVKDNKPRASLMEIHPKSVDRGADISDFSQYPLEREFLFVPMSFVQGEGRCRLEVGPDGGLLTVISVRVNINLKSETVEQLKGKKKSMHITAFKYIIDETQLWMRAYAEEGGRLHLRASIDKCYNAGDKDISWLISKIVDQMKEIKEADSELPVEDYVNDLKYKATVTRMLSSKAWAKEKLLLWFVKQNITIDDIYFTPLKHAHREWFSVLKRQYNAASTSSIERKMAATQILQCKGLMVSDNALKEETDGMPIICAAAADGWALDDLLYLIDAGACPVIADNGGVTALHEASQNGDKAAVEALVTARADVNQLDKSGKSPVYYASEWGMVSCVEVLITLNADLLQCDRSGKSPLYAASEWGHDSCVKLLIKHNANVLQCDQ